MEKISIFAEKPSYTIYLDIDLCQAILGSDISIWFLHLWKDLTIEEKSGHGSMLRCFHLFLEGHPKSPKGIHFSSLNYSVVNKVDSRPLYAAASLAQCH